MDYPVRESAAGWKGSDMTRVRVELFFKGESELRDRVRFLYGKGVRAFNLVHKNKRDSILEWVNIIKEEVPESSICAHYSLKYNKCAQRNGGDDATFDMFYAFLTDMMKQCTGGTAAELLLISGSGMTGTLTSAAALYRLKIERSSIACSSKLQIGVAFNPFFPSEQERQQERNRLIEKLDSLQVHKVYFQFGTDLSLLRSSLQWLLDLQQERGVTVSLSGSIFLPTAKLVAQQKFRPWSGVFLSKGFLESKEMARKIVTDMIQLYRSYDVELLIEAPGVRNDKDFSILESLLQDCNTKDTPTESELVGSCKQTAQDKLHKRKFADNRGMDQIHRRQHIMTPPT